MKIKFSILRFLLFFAFLFFGASVAHAQKVKGRVLDAETGESMPGVAIQYNQTLNEGTVSDMDGYFVIENIREVQSVVFSFIGYRTENISRVELPRNGSLWEVELSPESAQLNEVEVIAGENPALRIVRKAIENRDLNNPNKYPSYEYVSYNKNVITYRMDLPDSLKSRRDSLQFMKDTNLAKTRHMLVLESVTKKFYKDPEKARERIIGTKISGFNDPSIGISPDGEENFGFHDNIIEHVNKKFVNPLANGADKKYVYILKDTMYDGIDTIFVMDYFPEKGKNFDSFKGEMSIHTRKWALVHVTAYPYDVGKINVYMEQTYAWLQNKYWFPMKMELEMELEKVPLRNTGAVMIAKTRLDSVVIGAQYPDEMFSHIEVDLVKSAGLVDDAFWEHHRTEGLSEKEVETYRQMDSIGNRYKFDALMRATKNIYDGFIVVNKFEIEYSKLVAYNQYEGLRLGLGLYTGEDISEKFRVGGYFGYGFNDQAWKYGGKFYWYFNKPRDFYIMASHLHDVRDPGGIRLRYSEWNSVAQQFFNKLMDKVDETSLSLTFRPTTYTKMTVGVRQFTILPTYDYTFLGSDVAGENQAGPYNFAEAQVGIRWQHKEKFSTNWGQRISYGSEFPIVSFNYSRGIKGAFNSEFEYNKFEVGIFYKRFTKGLGKTRVQIEAGYVDKSVPWSMNFSGRPSFNPSFSVVVRETFQTMRFNEFSSTQYAAFFFMHDFGPLLVRTRIFKPEFRLFQGITFGTMRNRDLHQGVDFQGLDKGYYESGLVVDNILRINLFNVGYIGFGAGAFYRYGPYSLPNERDNWAFKLAVMYSVN